MKKIVLKNTGGVDVVIEAAGSPQTHREALHICHKGGVVVFVGWSPEAEIPLNVHQIGSKELNIRGMFRYRNVYPEAVDLIEKGLVDVETLISHRYDLRPKLSGF